jgi:hypothetical protein
MLHACSCLSTVVKIDKFLRTLAKIYASEVDPNAVLGPYHGFGSFSCPPVITEAWFQNRAENPDFVVGQVLSGMFFSACFRLPLFVSFHKYFRFIRSFV